jgi:hypothetical protein
MRLPPLAALFYSLNSLRARHRAFNSTLNIQITHAVSCRRHLPLQSRSVAVPKAGMTPVEAAAAADWQGARHGAA